MLSLASWLTVGHLLTSPLYPADFQLIPGPQAPSSPPIVLLPRTDSDTPVETYAPPRYSIAHGFGSEIPLSFAVKQMVPPMFRVIYRNSVDQNLAVDWSGGRPWTQALGTALRQHGLHMMLVGRTVTIGN
jgi:hypothetical protein